MNNDDSKIIYSKGTERRSSRKSNLLPRFLEVNEMEEILDMHGKPPPKARRRHAKHVNNGHKDDHFIYEKRREQHREVLMSNT
mmetsp:Transcript_36407/g.114119  ORF Transcript_36407/g.114119 Transcript_36407/m.114119 type:complete len:83 (+) Transcript_36407:1006-1254(+)